MVRMTTIDLNSDVGESLGRWTYLAVAAAVTIVGIALGRDTRPEEDEAMLGKPAS
jgi:lactam utilization protein B